MTVTDEELLISPPPAPQFQPPRRVVPPPQTIRIECQAEERHFLNDPSQKISTSIKPIRFTVDEHVKPGKYRSEILVQNNPDLDLYVKRLRVAFQTHDDPRTTTTTRISPRSRSLNARFEENKSSKSRPVSLPRSNSQAILHQWIDDICSNATLLADDDICFFIKNGEFLARI